MSKRPQSGKLGVRWNVRFRKWCARGGGVVLGYFDSVHAAIRVRAEYELMRARLKAEAKAGRLVKVDRQAFYRSYEWRRVRVDVLQRDVATCQCCGATRATGAVLHVDHIKPLSLRPDLRLDPANLQTLCADCNIGKGNRHQTDWRAPPRDRGTI